MSISFCDPHGLLPAVVSLSMGFLRKEYWSGLPFPPPGDVPDPGTEPASPVSRSLQADSFTPEDLSPCSERCHTLSPKAHPCRPSAAAAKSLQLCPTLCDPRDTSPPGSPLELINGAGFHKWNSHYESPLNVSCASLS